MSDPLKIKPFASKGEPVFTGGKVQLLPVQLFSLPNEEIVFRVGRTTFWFDSSGHYLGTECRVPPAAPTAPFPKELDALREAAELGRWHLPDVEYFERGSPEHECERSADPGSPREEVAD